MKKSSLVLVALLLVSPVFADEVQIQAEPELASISADTSASLNLQNIDVADLGAFLDKKVQEVSDLLSAKIADELPALISEEVAVNTKL